MNTISKDGEKCKRCGKEYPVKGIMVCSCSSVFDKNFESGKYFEFKDEENLKRGMTWFESQIEEAKASERKRTMDEWYKKLESRKKMYELGVQDERKRCLEDIFEIKNKISKDIVTKGDSNPYDIRRMLLTLASKLEAISAISSKSKDK